MTTEDGFFYNIIWALKPSIVMLVPLAITISYLWIYKRWFLNKNRRSPLNFELNRTPGYGLRKKIEDLNYDVMSDLSLTMVLPLAMYTLYLDRTKASITITFWPIGIVYFLGYIYFLYQFIRHLKCRQKYIEALDGELATAQCFETVIAGGGKIFHDFQAEGFNIDHIVVTMAGVFAVETKHRLKPTNVKPNEMAKIKFDGKILQFPGWVETLPVDQARRQADWLAKFLTKSTGESTQVKAVLAFPGWFVDRTGRSDVIVVNPKNNSFMLKSQDGQTIAEDRKQRICFQLEQRCQESAETNTKKKK